MTSRTRWFGVIVLATALLAFVGSAQAKQKDDSDVIVCQTLASCLADIPQPGGDGDLSGTYASVPVSVVNDDGGDDTTVASGDSQDAPSTATVPQVVTTPTVTTSGDATTTPTKQVVTPPPPPPSACSNIPGLTAVPATMNRDGSGVCTPKCLNHPDYTVVPDGWMVVNGICNQPRGEDRFGTCLNDQFVLAEKSKVDGLLSTGYRMSIYVAGTGSGSGLNCIITDVTTYGLNPGDYVFSGKYVQDAGPVDGIFDTPTPYAGWEPLYPYWVPKSQATQFVQRQSLASITAYGLLWGGKRYASANSFSKLLHKQGGSWKGWKKNHTSFAAVLVAHQHLMRLLK